MEFGQYYKVNEEYDITLSPGEHTATIYDVEIKTTKNGHNMAVITLLINRFRVFYYLIENTTDALSIERSNAGMTRFFDCFDITRGNFNTNSWCGNKGRVLLGYGKEAENGKRYLEVKKLIVNKQSQYPQQATERGQANAYPQGSQYPQQATERQQANAYPQGSQYPQQATERQQTGAYPQGSQYPQQGTERGQANAYPQGSQYSYNNDEADNWLEDEDEEMIY